MDFTKRIAKCEEALRAGRPSAVAGVIRGVNPLKVPRNVRLPLANICRRAGLWTFGLRLLTPIVNGDGEATLQPASGEEMAEYAVLLMKIGSIREALSLLSKLDSADALLYRGFCHMNQWEYSEAAELLEQHQRIVTDPYKQVISQVNLASALVYTDRAVEALPIITKAIDYTRTQGYTRLLANFLELRAQIALAQGRDRECEFDLTQAAGILGGEKTNDQLYLLKWRSVLAARKTGSLEPLVSFRAEAEARGDWESVREADFQSLKLVYSKELFQRLLWGTPSQSFRARLLKLSPLPSAESYSFGHAGGLTLNLNTGELSNGGVCTGKILQVLQSLMSDFYSPLRIGTLFSHLFPDEHFHFLHSPNRVHQLLKRTRAWLKENHIEAEIVERDFRYSLKITGAFAITLGLDRGTLATEEVRLQQVIGHLDGIFSSTEVQKLWGASEATVRRWIRSSLDSGRLRKIRDGRKIMYKVAA